jgi:hypothetical protein
MKHTFFSLLLVSIAVASSNQTEISLQKNESVKKAIQRVEEARVNTIAALQNMIQTVESARAKSKTYKNINIAIKIIEAHALGEIAKSVADVEITKARSTTRITQAMDKLDSNSLDIIADSIAEVEVAKAKAKERIINAIQHVEISKTKPTPKLKYPNETLTIAKNLAAIQIAKAVAQTEMQRAISNVEVAKSKTSFEDKNRDNAFNKRTKEELEHIQAKATANISSYLARIELVKANMISKIAKEIADVEILKMKIPNSNKNSTYPKKLIKVN